MELEMEEINLVSWKTRLDELVNFENPRKWWPSTVLFFKLKQDDAYITVPAELEDSTQPYNQFTNHSLTICSILNSKFGMQTLFQNEIKLDQFSIRFGSCITTLTLVDVNVQCYYLHSILANTPNLKSLLLERVQHLEDKCNTNSCRKISSQPEDFSKHLNNFRIYGDCPEFWVQWILVPVGLQLVRLTLDSFSPAQLSACRKVFVNLKELTIFNPVFQGFFDLVGANFAPAVEYLVIKLDENKLPEDQDLAKFITCFQTKLTHLCLNVELKGLEKYFDEWRMHGITFSQLTSLILKTSTTEDNWKETLQAVDAIGIMPNLKNVDYIPFSKSG